MIVTLVAVGFADAGVFRAVTLGANRGVIWPGLLKGLPVPWYSVSISRMRARRVSVKP